MRRNSFFEPIDTSSNTDFHHRLTEVEKISELESGQPLID